LVEMADPPACLGGVDNRKYRTRNFKRRNKCKKETI